MRDSYNDWNTILANVVNNSAIILLVWIQDPALSNDVDQEVQAISEGVK